MTEISIRYYAKDDAYFVEIRDAHYFEADKKLHRIGKELNRVPKNDAERRPFLEARRETLKKARQNAQKYFPIAETDIPPGMKVRPIYKLPETVIFDYGIARAALRGKENS